MKRMLTFLLTLLSFAKMTAQEDSVAHVVHFSEADGYEQSVVNHAIQDSRGYIWLCTWNGLLRYDGYRFHSYKARPGDNSPLRTNRIGTVRELSKGDMECTTIDSMTCVLHVQTGRFEQTTGDYSKRPRPYIADTATVLRIRNLPEFHDSYVRILLVDRQGGIWVDTHSGLYRIWFSRKPVQPMKFGTESEEVVRCLHSDRQGRIWVADKNGFVRIFTQRWSNPLFLTPQGQLSPSATPFRLKVYCIFEDSRGQLWLGCKPGGLVKLSPNAQQPLSYSVTRYSHRDDDPNSLSCDNVYDIAEDAQGRLWIATYKGGLNMLDLRAGRDAFVHNGNQLTHWPADDGSSKMHCLYITPGQVLVAGTLSGLYTAKITANLKAMLFHRHQRRAADATSLSYNWVMHVQPLPDGQLAVATAGGGICLTHQDQLLQDTIRFRTYSTEHGLASDVCESMLYIPRDTSLCLVSQTAISRLSLRDNTITNYLRGTLATHFNLLETTPLLTADGHLLFGTTQGLLDLQMDDTRKSRFRPSLVFEPLTEGTLLDAATIQLSPDERDLTLRFAALDYNKRVPLTYAYRIDGMTDRWTYITDNHITLPDIPAGTYLLHLRSTNGDGVWVDNEQTLTIHRQAAFSETPWFWMLIGLLLTLLAIGVVQLVRYIRRLQGEIKDIRLTSNQRIEVMSERIRELLSIREKIEPVDEQQEHIENDEEHRFAEHVRTYINDHLDNSDLSVQDIASEMAVSRTVLFARMKSIFGTSPNNYVLNQRIERSKKLLRQPNAYITDIAYRCGFADPKYFSKCFKKLTGQTPSEFQKL